ncbi:hypothetical protein G1H11_02620 [Phytoactinopolyspora alkaliphila]|uniref:ATP-grasp domain-containing protein n=1 Tax=Phytoactinopolyspora alkaliphila TaxID=1783498 RepID=A0A6N9YGR5_9ACTN|nr:hypothetical protein [Phytoactinopolyspora alkaliphila]NED94196.1 hypothetical protein [Phytoactinopolyspora alkaliphila]
MARIALATCAELPALDDDERRVLPPLAERGIEATPVVWNDPAADWTAFELVVLRSTWDYTLRRAEFLAWADAMPSLLNPAAVVRWNTDKRYLRDLEVAGVPVVATQWIEPGESVVVPGERGVDLPAIARADEYVVKPSVSAGSVDTGRYRKDDDEHRELAREHVARVTGRGGTVMIQPYLSAVDAFGETSMLYIGGEFSHAIRKGPMLDGPDRGVEGLFREERITPRTPSDVEHKVAELALAAIPGGAELLYARVDLIPGADGSPIVLELELTEPSLFLEHGPGAPDRFAAAIHRALVS